MTGMLAMGATALIAGEVWNIWFPINKNLWTSSYVLFTAGCALLCLAFCYWITDIRQFRGWWSMALVIFGMNAIAAYVLSELLSLPMRWQDYIFQHFFPPDSFPAMASLTVFAGHSRTMFSACLVDVSARNLPQSLTAGILRRFHSLPRNANQTSFLHQMRGIDGLCPLT